MRRIKKLEVTALALCRRGKNRLPGLYKSEDGGVEIATTAVKSDAEKGELLTLVYAPELPDSDKDLASAEVIRGAAHHFMRSGAALDIEHDGKKLKPSQAYVAESFIVQQGDPRFADAKDSDGNAIKSEGAWGVLVQIDDPEIRQAYREQGWDGISLFAPKGKVAFEAVSKSDTESIADALVAALRKTSKGTETDDMDIKEITTALAANNALLIEGLAKALKPEPAKKDEEPAKEASAVKPPQFKGDPFNVQHLRDHATALKRHKLVSETKWDDPESIEAAAAKLGEAGLDAGAPAGGGDAGAAQKSDRERELETELARLRRSSSQPIAKSEEQYAANGPLSKSDAQALEDGRKAGREFSKSMGWSK